jgi:acyl-CoA synthetase (NDP forming)
MVSAKTYHNDSEIPGVIITSMERAGREVIIGMTRDQTFGATIMFGLGGIFVEALKDVSFRIAPLTPRDAREMVQEIKGYRVLTGIRGQKAVSIDAILEIILRISALVTEHPEISELDLNPIFTFENHASILDARILLAK